MRSNDNDLVLIPNGPEASAYLDYVMWMWDMFTYYSTDGGPCGIPN